MLTTRYYIDRNSKLARIPEREMRLLGARYERFPASRGSNRLRLTQGNSDTFLHYAINLDGSESLGHHQEWFRNFAAVLKGIVALQVQRIRKQEYV